MPLFAHPLALLTALSIPALLAIYFLRNRFHRHTVAGLFLWQRALQPKEGGTLIRRLTSSALFWLELFALIALTIAALDPVLPTSTAQQSLIVILDNSASMLAGKSGNRPRDQAITALRRAIRTGHFRHVSYILADSSPRLLDTTGGVLNKSELMRHWTCQMPEANLNRAIALAAEITARQSPLLVITDHAPPHPPQPPVRWLAFGTPRPNLAFTNARRTNNGNINRLFAAIANFSAAPQHITIPVTSGDTTLKSFNLRLNPGATTNIIMSLPPACGIVSLHLPHDSLSIDNSITLLPPPQHKISVTTKLSNPVLKTTATAALDATGLLKPANLTQSGAPPDLLITDTPPTNRIPATTWQMLFTVPNHPAAFRGPFVVDFNHPLMQGLNFNGVIWAGTTNHPAGRPLIMAGNFPLLTEQHSPSGKRIFRVCLDPRISSITQTTAWPALFWNLCQLRAANLPGISQANFAAGQTATIALPPGCRKATITQNNGQTETRAPSGHTISIPLATSGLYSCKAANLSCRMSANFLAPGESDLRRCTTGTWGAKLDNRVTVTTARSFAWLAALAALQALAIHTLLTARRNSVPTEDFA